MSTRATYQLNETTIYIHYDGYPEGAAEYFWNLHINKSKGNLATQFIRANEHAELTGSHESHADTEFRYTLKGNILTAQSENVEGNWVTFFEGDWHEFINKYAKHEKLSCVKTGYSNQWLTVAELEAVCRDAAKEYTEYAIKFPMHSGNLGGMKLKLETCLESYRLLKTA